MKLRSGDTAPQTGCYNMIDSNGKSINKVYVSEGDTMPPTPIEDCYYEFSEKE